VKPSLEATPFAAAAAMYQEQGQRLFMAVSTRRKYPYDVMLNV